jgi:MFS family permease
MKPTLSRGSAVALLVAGAYFMENLDGTIIVTALPQMARSFHVFALDLNIGVSAYLLTLAALIPASGWMADRYGLRTVFAGAIVVFTAADPHRVHPRPHPPGGGRRDDGACGPAGRAPHHREA